MNEENENNQHLTFTFSTSYNRNANRTIQTLKLLTLFLVLFFHIFFHFDFSVFLLFLCQTEKYFASHLLAYSEASIESSSVKQLLYKIITKTIFFLKKNLSYSFQYNLLNKKVCKFIKKEILHRYFSRAVVKRFIL